MAELEQFFRLDAKALEAPAGKRRPATPDDLDALETDVLARFILARAAAGSSDGTIGSDVVQLATAGVRR
ncbi:hypothetical protein [Nonomuraea sp. CA-141351]|uniref:hypothetical protein n=1 Tax=Nonomuraea sp. CA-141351 TaxID=3239996 RepID=UPI003D8CE494